jgi:glycosyltransferase involved in cell wall biosynthesis
LKIILLAPHPFFQNRGTPIDVLLVLKVLAYRKNTTVDLLVYNEGSDVNLPHLRIFRTPPLKLTRNVRPGFSFKKIVTDFFMFLTAWCLVRRYDLIHAGEEAVFFALFFRFMYRIPYVYDLDSSIAQQMVEKYPILSIFSSLFNFIEGLTIRKSLACLPVCNALAELCRENGSKKTVTLHDISQLKNPHAPATGKLRKDLGIKGLILLYCGNLEKYQGIDLLLEGFAVACKKTDKVDLVIIGGTQIDIKFYRAKARRLGLDRKVHFLGPKPFEQLDEFLIEADILVAPRIKGVNTPMKVFPYLHSGKPVLLTDLYTHTQILTKQEAYLAPPDPRGFADGILHLANDKNLRQKLGRKGRAFVEKNHTFEAHSMRLNEVYDWIEEQLEAARVSDESASGVA